MAVKKSRTTFVCHQCGSSSPAYLGRCPRCGAWSSLVETIEERASPSESRVVGVAPVPTPLSSVTSSAEARLTLSISELDRVLGGGIVPGSLVLLGGDPGIGKSTLLLQVADKLSTAEGPVLYVSGEESERQIKLRGERLGLQAPNLLLLPETTLELIQREIE